MFVIFFQKKLTFPCKIVDLALKLIYVDFIIDSKGGALWIVPAF